MRYAFTHHALRQAARHVPLHMHVRFIMKRNYRSIAVCAIILLCACGTEIQRSVSDAEILTVDPSQSIPIDSLVGDIEMLSLNGEDLIGGIDRIMFSGENIIVADYNYSKSVVIYDKHGNQTAAVKNIGRSDNEYSGIDYVTLTSDRQNIVIYDNSSNKILYYKLDGQFVGSRKPPFYLLWLEYLNDRESVVATYNNSGQPYLKQNETGDDILLFVDDEFDISASALPSRHNDSYHYTVPSVYESGTCLYVNMQFCDTVYRVDAGSIFPAYVVDMSKIGGFANFGADATGKDVEKMMSERPLFSGLAGIGQSYLLYNIIMPPAARGVSYVYSRDTKRNYRIEYGTGYALKDFLLINMFRIRAAAGDAFVGYVPASEIIMCTSSELRAQDETLRNLTEESNPVLVFYKLRGGL